MGDFEIIYETKGKAREYAPLGVELYTGCRLGCRYCFVSKLRKITIEQFHNDARPVENAISKLEKDAKRLKTRQDDRKILLCFESDPYQFPKNKKQHITREAIEILKEYGLRFTILTKAGFRGTYDFDLLKGYKKASFGTTIIFTDQGDAKKWEPGAANINFRIKAIEMAREKDIKTWVSIEPVIDPNQALQLIEKYHPIVDHWKIGKINYHPEIEAKVDWIRFREEVKSLLDSLGADYYLKKSLTDWSGAESKKKDLKMNILTAGGKMAKPKLAKINSDLKIIPGDTRILLIAPHGVSVPGKKKDDINTDKLTEKIANRIKCSAIINSLIKRDKLDLNAISQAEKHPQFINALNNIVGKDGHTLVVWLHGAHDGSIKKEAKIKASGFKDKPEALHALIGYGQGPNPIVPAAKRKVKDKKSKLTATQETVKKFRELLTENGMTTILTRDDAPNFRGRHLDNMNQWFLNQGYDLSKVQSVQLEIRKIGFRDTDENIMKTVNIISKVLSAIVVHKPQAILPTQEADDPGPWIKELATNVQAEQAGDLPRVEKGPDEKIEDMEIIDIPVESDPVEMVLVEEAYRHLAAIFSKHYENAMIEAGQYIIEKFYNGSLELARDNKPIKKTSLRKLEDLLKTKNPNAPSKSWLHYSIQLFVETKEIKEKESIITVQTYGQLPVSHKILLFPIRKRDTKIQLIQETVENNYSVVALKNRIAELKTAEKPKVEAPKSLLQVVKNPDLLFSDNYISERDIKSLSKLKPAQLEKIHTRITEKLERIEEELNEFQTAVETHKGHLKQYKRFITSVEAAKKKLPK